MDGATFDAERLLAPNSMDSFLQQAWEATPYIIHRQIPDYYQDLFSLADLDEVIAFTRPRFSEPLYHGEIPRSPTSFIQGWSPDQRDTPTDFYHGIGELREAYSQGKSVVIRAMHLRWPAVASLCRSFEQVFHCPVHANLYLTPPNSQAFPPHIDTHEVFALQLDGSKNWRLYGQVATFPLMEDKTSLPRSSLGPSRDVRLEAGDLLYLPRGHAHEALTDNNSSLHLTIGVHVYRWADLLHRALSNVTRKNSLFRESLPKSALTGEWDQGLQQRFHELLQALSSTACLKDAATSLDDEFFDGLRMLPGRRFMAATGLEEIDGSTAIEKSPTAICRVFMEGTESVIEFPGGRVTGPGRIIDAFRFIAGTSRFQVSELPDDLGEKGKVVLVQRLLRAGLLDIAAIHAGSTSNNRKNGIHRSAVTFAE